MTISAVMYFFKHEMVSQTFSNLGFPTYIIYPLAIAKILGLIAIWTRLSNMLTEWAYAGFFFDVVLALAAHLSVNDGAHLVSLVGLVLVITSRLTYGKLYN